MRSREQMKSPLDDTASPQSVRQSPQSGAAHHVHGDGGGRPWPASSMMSKRWFDESDRERLRVLSDPSREYKLAGAAD